MKTTNTTNCTASIENIAKNAIIEDRRKREKTAVELIRKLSDEKIMEIMELFR